MEKKKYQTISTNKSLKAQEKQTELIQMSHLTYGAQKTQVLIVIFSLRGYLVHYALTALVHNRLNILRAKGLSCGTINLNL